MLNVNVKLNGMVSEALTKGVNMNDVYALYVNPWEASTMVINNKEYLVDYISVKDETVTINLL